MTQHALWAVTEVEKNQNQNPKNRARTKLDARTKIDASLNTLLTF